MSLSRKILRSDLPRGSWDADIDSHPEESYKFTHAGYGCEITRNSQWTYCCYVQLPYSHPDYYKHYDDIDFDKDVTPHGGLTHGNERGEFGIDFSHASDIRPRQAYLDEFDREIGYTISESHYWTFEEAKREIEKLADQFKTRE